MGRPRMFDGRSERALVVPALVLAFAIVWAWAAVLAGGPMGGSVAAFLVAWVAMMAAMMLPSAAPMVLLYRLSGSGPRGEVRTLVFASGYLLVWGAVGLAAYAVAAASAAVTPGSRSVVAAAVLVLAGVYQFTPLKGACLRACRTPADFLMQHWRGGCPCSVNGGPTVGHCEGGWTWWIEAGKYGELDVSGLHLGLYADWPAAIHEGNGVATALVDERASDAQRTALAGMVVGDAGGPWAIFRKTFTAVHGPAYVRYA